MNLPDLLFEAIVSGRPKLVSALLAETENDLCSISPGGRPYVLTAARYGTVEVMQLGLSGGAQIDAREHSGKTGLMVAAELGRADMVQLLLSHGADKALVDRRGWNALDWARYSAPVEVERLLQ